MDTLYRYHYITIFFRYRKKRGSSMLENNRTFEPKRLYLVDSLVVWPTRNITLKYFWRVTWDQQPFSLAPIYTLKSSKRPFSMKEHFSTISFGFRQCELSHCWRRCRWWWYVWLLRVLFIMSIAAHARLRCLIVFCQPSSLFYLRTLLANVSWKS